MWERHKERICLADKRTHPFAGQVQRCGAMRGIGSPIVTTTDGHSQMLGDGFLDTFDRPARAVLCACAYPPGGAHEYQAQVCV